jgi:hypothetical protein
VRLEALGWEGGTGHSPEDATTLGAAPDGGLFTEVPGRGQAVEKRALRHENRGVGSISFPTPQGRRHNQP